MIIKNNTALQFSKGNDMDNFTVIKNLFKDLNKVWDEASEEEREFIVAMLDKFNNLKF